MNAIQAFARAAARSRLALIARHRRVVEVLAARALHQVAAVSGHVAKLPRGTREDGLRQERIVLAYERVVGCVCVLRQRADSDAAVLSGFDVGKIQARQVNQFVRTLDVFFHQIENVGPTGQELRIRIRGHSACGRRSIARSRVLKRSHRFATPF